MMTIPLTFFLFPDMDDGVFDVAAIQATLAFESQARTLIVEEFLNHHGSPATCTRHSALLVDCLAWVVIVVRYLLV